ncbi:MAG: trimethylamine methyltransferase family protein [Alphaproteobacteria bacterium]|nr:trimethylamine methyltransferase family protein [Alphaproteobacteria bacterium]
MFDSGALTNAGAGLCPNNGRLPFLKSYIEDVVARCNRTSLLAVRNPDWDIHPYGENTYTGTAVAAVNVVDIDNNTYRDSTLQDLYDSARVMDELDHVHYFQRTLR